MSSKIVYVDMDGVLCNFVKTACKYLGYDNYENFISPEKSMNISQKDFWGRLEDIQSEGKFWDSHEEFEWTRKLIDFLENEDCEWYILTSPSTNSNSASGKIQWLQKRFGKTFKQYIITKHKHLLAKSNTLLIDDTEEKCNNFEKAGGKIVLFPQNWNKNNTIEDKFNYTKQKIEDFLNEI